MMILGVVLLILGWYYAASFLMVLGTILLVAGLVLMLIPAITGGRRLF